MKIIQGWLVNLQHVVQGTTVSLYSPYHLHDVANMPRPQTLLSLKYYFYVLGGGCLIE